MFFEPLDQFFIFRILKESSCIFLSFNIDNVFLVVILNFIIIIFWVMLPWFASNLKTWNKNEVILFLILIFIKNIVHENINMKNKNFLTYLLLLFFFILISNLVGMIPYALTVTSYLIVSFFFSLVTFLGLNWIGILYNGASIWRLFLPEGIPLIISIFLVGIEFISYMSKVLSLSIRLFANMMSGHTLLKILISFAWTIIWFGFAFSFIAILPTTVVFLTTGLEFIIACLQAYVYIILVSIYLNDLINLH
jgi:ATP synthase subunit 6